MSAWVAEWESIPTRRMVAVKQASMLPHGDILAALVSARRGGHILAAWPGPCPLPCGWTATGVGWQAVVVWAHAPGSFHDAIGLDTRPVVVIHARRWRHLWRALRAVRMAWGAGMEPAPAEDTSSARMRLHALVRGGD